MSHFFIERPIFAWVLAIIIMLAGSICMFTLPIAQYPPIAPPTVTVTAAYPGASAATMDSAVVRPIEQQLNGIDNLEYFSSISDNSGGARLTLVFSPGADPNIAQVQVQNRLDRAKPILPEEVQRQGLVVAKGANSPVMAIAFFAENGQYSDGDIGDIVASHALDPISRVQGVGDAFLAATGAYAIRIWADPFKLAKYGLTVSDVKNAIRAQNVQVAAGQIGASPSPAEQMISATVNGQSRLERPEQFRAIILKSATDGSNVTIGDVARVEMGQENYNLLSMYNGSPSAAILIRPTPGANMLLMADAVRAKAKEIGRSLPPGVKVVVPYDSAPFVRQSIEQVFKTLVEAIILVFIVMFLFLQNWRATIIPTIAVPVVLLGVFGVLAALNYSINTLTMFAMVLAIGLLVDDAIVVVENVERIIEEEKLSPKEATRKSMREITGALIGIVLVLVAVLLPMAFFGGSTGVIYRQFSITIVAAMLLSVFVALILTPALCATILRPHTKTRSEAAGPFGWFNRTFDRGVHEYTGGLTKAIARPRWRAILFAVVCALTTILFVRLPTSFLPDEDQGLVFGIIQLPAGATLARTHEINKEINDYFFEKEKGNIAAALCFAGFSGAGNGQNAGQCFFNLTDWKYRHGKENSAAAIAMRANIALAQQIRGAAVFALVPPSVLELGNATGFDFQLQDLTGVGHQKLAEAQNQLLGMAAQNPKVVAVRPNNLPDVPQLKVDIDIPRAASLGLSMTDINDTLSTAWGGAYVNDFVDRGRIKRVYVQGDAPYRSRPEDLERWYVRGASGEMTPFSAFATTRWEYGPSSLSRYNGLPSLQIQGAPAPGRSSGEAMDEMAKMAAKLPPGIGFDWTGISYEERAAGNQAPLLYALSITIVFLTLAALYESWTVPVAVLLVVPLGLFGAVLAVTLRGLSNDVFFQVGILTTMGLAAKNAILIVEFAERARRAGGDVVHSAVEGARLRLRPILMTSLAFVAGVTPLAIASGPGAGGQIDIGTVVIGGVISATVFAIFFVPLFYVFVHRASEALFHRLRRSPDAANA